MPTVVIADDEDYVRECLKAVLYSIDFEVVAEAGRGDKLPDIMTEQQPDILFLDINMPGLTGIEFLKKYSAEYPKTCVIILTSQALSTLIDEASLLGVKCFLRKDTPVDEMLKAIKAAWAQFVKEN